MAKENGKLPWLPPGGGEMGERIRRFDWASSPLGPMEQWPASLKTAVQIMLNSRYPMFVWWGPELINLYNDGYIPVVGSRHVHALGASAPKLWSEIWHDVGPLARDVMERGKATWNERTLLLMERHGFREETYFTFSYSPAPDDDGGIGGVFCACSEETNQVLGERRLLALRQLASATAEAKSEQEACQIAGNVLAGHPRDVAFALIYRLQEGGAIATLTAAAGVEPGSSLAPREVSTEVNGAGPWPFHTAQAGQRVVISDLHAEDLPDGAWAEPCHTAVVLPLVKGGREKPTGFLVAGVSPVRPFDDNYQGFFDLLAASVAAAITNARAYEETRKRAEALAELDRAKTVFFSNITHELRTPLTLILGPVEDAMRQEMLPPRILTDLETAHRNALRLLRLVNGMLDFSRIEAGRIQASYEPTNLAQLTSDVASVFRAAVEKAELQLTIECPALPEPVYVDREMWEKIVVNLLSNAFKYTLQGSIRVRQTAAKNSVELEVSDTGAGIPESEQLHVFDRFHRVEGAQGRTHEGSGIGLALVHELTRLHGGSIALQSVPGQGSTFTVRLPFGAAHLPQEQIRSAASESAAFRDAGAFLQEAQQWVPVSGESAPSRQRMEERILVADDNADMRSYIERILSPHYAVETVSDGEFALASARREKPGLVLADVMMPRMDGFALLKALRSGPATSDIPVVLLTARAGEDAMVEGMEAGADDYLTKPFTARELLARVGGHLDTARRRRLAAEELRISREQLARQVSNFETLLREIPVGIAVATDPDCRDIQSNREFARMLGIAPDENASKSGANPGFLVVREGREVPTDELPMQIAAQHGREVRDFEADIVRSDGTIIRELMHAVPLFDEGGAVRGSLAVAVDITERRRADEALRESEQRFRNMAENAPVMIWVTDPAGCCTYINRQWLEFTGTTLEENLGMGWTNAAHPDDRAIAGEVFLQANRQRAPFRLEYRLGRRDGQWRWAVDSATPRFATDGSFLGFIGSVIDITERKEMEQALQASEEQLALAQEAAGVGSWNWHPQTGVASFSGEYFSLHGLPRDRGPVSYEEWLSLVHPEDKARVHAEMQHALTESHALDTEFRVVHPDGRVRWLAGKGTVFCDNEGRAARFTGVHYDVTVRKEAERELVRSNEDLKQFAYAASHDLQEPLRVVINYTQLLERRYKEQLDANAGKIIGTAVDGALRMERLLRGLRDYWQVSERQSAALERIDLSDVLEKALLNVQDAVIETGAAIHSSPLPEVYAVETPMMQVFQNLLANALKYRSPERNPEISIGAEQRPNEWVISVTDNGLGIDPQYADQIFGIFKRLHGPEYAGAGIGLSICHKIIERLGGRIWVESHPGKGSTFRFSLPKRY